MTNAEQLRTYRARAKTEGRCQVCRKRKPRAGVATCDDCLARIKATPKTARRLAADRARNKRNAKKVRERRMTAGMCGRCGALPRLPERTQCQPCLDRCAERTRKYKLMQDVMLHRWADDGGPA